MRKIIEKARTLKIYKRLRLFYCFPVVAEKEEMSGVRIGELEKFYKNRKWQKSKQER